MTGNKTIETIASFFNHLACLRHTGYSLEDDMPKQQKDFYMAAMTGDLWAIRNIVKKYPDAPRWKDKEGFTGLMFAAREGREDVVNFLTPLSDLNAKTDFGYDALKFSRGTPHGAAHAGVTAILERAPDGAAGNSSRSMAPAVS